MKKFLVLTRVLLKSGFGNVAYDQGKKRHSSLRKAMLYIFLGICILPFAVLMGIMGYAGCKTFQAIGLNTGIIIGLACFMGVFVAFFTGMTACVGVFFNSGDTEFLLPMPLRAEHIVGAKFVTMYVYVMVTDLLFVMPIFTGYGIASGAGAAFWIISILTAVLIPITPLVYGSILSMALIRVFKKARNKDFLTIITSAFAIIMVLVVNVFTQSMGDATNEEMLQALVGKGESFLGVINNIFPNTMLAEKAITGENPLMLLLFILSGIAFVLIFILVAKLVYISSVVEMSQTKSGRKKLSEASLSKFGAKRSQIKAYVLKEFKLALRTPIYFMNCVMMSVIWPVIMLIPIIAGLMGGGGEPSNEEAGEISLNALISSNSQASAGICMGLVFVISALSVSLSMLNNTCISREGKNVIFMKYIPMSYKDQFIAKLLPGILLTLVTGTGYSIIAVIIAAVGFGITFPPAGIALAFIISLLTLAVFNLVAIIPDIIKPKLEWQTEQAAVKQNIVALIPMLITMFAGFAVVFAGVRLYIGAGLNIYVVGGLIIAFLAILAAVLYLLASKLAAKYFPEY